METKHVINIAGTECSPEADEAFNKWYDEKHIPLNMKFKGLIGVTRYRLVRFTDSAIVKEYPRYFTTYEFKDLETFKAWNASPELAEAASDVGEITVKMGLKLLWRVQYECMKTRRNTPPFSVITFVGTQCPPETEAKFDVWYSEKHIPDLLKFKGLEGVTRYRLASSSYLGVKLSTAPEIKAKEYPEFLTFYYFEDLPTNDAYDTSHERTATLEEAGNVQKETGFSILWRAQYEPMRTWQR